MTRIVAVSDTHMYHEKLVIPDGDILVHAGDMTRSGKLSEVTMVGEWLNSQPHKHYLTSAPYPRLSCAALAASSFRRLFTFV